MKGDLHVRFREKFEVKVLLLTRLRGERKSPLLDYGEKRKKTTVPQDHKIIEGNQ